MDENKPWFSNKNLLKAYEDSYESAKNIKDGNGLYYEIPFEEIFCNELGKNLDEKFGKYWVINPAIVNYGNIMVEDASEQYSTKSEVLDDYQ